MIPSSLPLTSWSLLRGLPASEVERLARQAEVRVRHCLRDEILAFEEDECHSIGIVLSGTIHIQRQYPSGKAVILETFSAGGSFGEALIFSDHGRYPATVVAAEESRVAFLSRASVIRFCAESPAFLQRFLNLLSNRVLMLNAKIKNLSYTSVRQKVAHYLLEERRRQGRDSLHLTWTRNEMASGLGVPRPSLSRELAAMKADGLLDFDRNQVRLLDLAGLEACLLG